MASSSARAMLVLSLAGIAAADCQSYGDDYQNGGSYYQNSNLNQTFTAFQQFDGCNNATSHNVLVDPNGGQTECSQTPMLPSNTSQTVTCDSWNNANMYTGDWSILVISNNQNGSAIAFQRDFHLDVSAPNVTVSAQASTTTTISAVSTSVTTITSVVTTSSNLVGVGSSNSSQPTTANASASTTSTSQASSTPYPMSNGTSMVSAPSTSPAASRTASGQSSLLSTITTPSVSIANPSISIPGIGTSESTANAATVTSFSAITETTTITGSECPQSIITEASSLAREPDRVGKIVPSILGALDAMAASVISKAESAANHARSTPAPTPMLMSAKFKRALIESREPSEDVKAAFVQERAAMLHGNHIAKRHPDNYTTTVTTGTTTHSVTSYVSTAVNTTTVYHTTTAVGLIGRDAQSTITTVLPTTIHETVTASPACSSTDDNFF